MRLEVLIFAPIVVTIPSWSRMHPGSGVFGSRGDSGEIGPNEIKGVPVFFLEAVLVDFYLGLSFGGCEVGSFVVLMDAVDVVGEGEVESGTPQSQEEVVVVVPEAVHEGFVEATYLFDLVGRQTADESEGSGEAGVG
ncbi:hypothetical protein LCGC14_1374480 [marine sediment metagenome]|uniref:Uncharacterized protein n=1 Tax=marine sediment metagenome TaxID=412755 RepID=A0A0F9K4F9_9ZZZZ